MSQANWQGPNLLATRKQLLSTSTGLYDDLKDFNFSTIQVSTLNVPQWISTSALYVSDIQGYRIDISGIVFDASGLLYAPLVSANQSIFNVMNVSTIKMEFKPTFSGDIKVTFDLGLGEAIGGLLGGLGAAVGGAFIGVGTGVGLAIQGAEQGIATMIAGRPQNFINNTVYETINFTSQLQISTLGNAYPLYSTIIRTVSSTSADQVPGPEMFLSTTFAPGTTCIRTVSDPFNLISGNSNLNTSTIQSFGQWTPLPSGGGGGSAGDVTFSTIRLNTDNTNPLSLNAFSSEVQATPYSNFISNPYSGFPPLQQMTSNTNLFMANQTFFSNTNTYISTNFNQFTSSITTLPGGIYQIPSSLISSLSLFSWDTTTTDGNFGTAFDVLGTQWPSTGIIDIRTNPSQSTLLQYGYLVNTWIPQGSTVRLTFDYDAAISSIISRPNALSTVITSQQEMAWAFETNPYELQLKIYNQATGVSATDPGGFQIQASTFVIGASPSSSASNQPGYAYQFNGNTYIDGTLEVQTLIALSSIIATSTFVDTQISTASIVADLANIVEVYGQEGYFSTIKASSNYNNDYVHFRSRVRMMGVSQPFSIVTGKNVNGFPVYTDESARFDFVTDPLPQAIYLESQPANNTLMTILSTNIEIPNLTVQNLTASNIVYSNADVPNLQTSTINFGWTGSFTSAVTPQASLQQSLTTPPGIYWSDYTAASNQVLKLMAFSNNVNMIGPQFSTPLTYLNTSFSGSNIQGWASTIFYNAQATTCRVNLVQGAGAGELSLQGQTNPVAVNLNTPNVSGLPVTVPTGSTYKFTCDGTTWTTASNAPVAGYVSYNNSLNVSMDFENTYISTSDTLTIAAEQINLLGTVNIPDTQFSNIYVNNFVSTNQIYVNADPPSGYGVTIQRNYTGNWNSQGTANPITMSNIVNSSDFLNNRTTPLVNPNRGYNAFNSYNLGEWNNSMFYVDTSAFSQVPIIILGDLIIKVPPPVYSGQFFINNTFDGISSNVPVYLNKEGLLSTIGTIGSNTFARLFTTTGADWAIQTNVPNPVASGPYSFSNFYKIAMNSLDTTVIYNAPVFESMPSLVKTTNKIIFDCPQIRVYTIESPSFVSREAGFEYNSYFDSNVVFTGSESDALNPILNSYSNYYYSVAAWSPQLWFSRMRTVSLGIQGFDIDAVPGLVSGTPGDFIWYSARYINVVETSGIAANIRENYFMTPKNYHTSFYWLGQI